MLVDKEETENESIVENARVVEMIPMDKERPHGRAKVAVEGHGLSFDYGSKKQPPVLSGADITVEKGVIYGLLGPSGCGKTTLLRCILGRLTPKNGVLRVYGRCPGENGFCIPGRAVGYMPQELALYPDITVEETLMYFGSLYLMNRKRLIERIAFLIKFLEIPVKDAFIRNLSGGQKRRVSFAAALIHEPPLLILDEPTVGVDPLLRHSIWQHLKEMTMTNNMTIIITTHYVEEARQANVVGLMRDGHLLAEMNPEVLIQRHGVHNLEDVFFKLCRKETSLLQQGNGPAAIAVSDGNCDRSQTTDKVWLTHEETNKVQVVENGKDEYVNPALSLLHPEEDEAEMKRIFRKRSLFTRMKESQLRMATLIAKSFICLKRNTIFALFQIFVPVIQVVVFCLAIGQEPFDLPLAIVNEEAGRYGFSGMFLNTLSNRTFKKDIFMNLSTALESVENRNSWGVMYIGPRFSSSLMDRFLEGNNVENSTIEGSVIKLYLDTTNQQIAITIYTKILRTFQSFAKEMLTTVYQNPRLSDAPVKLETPVYGELEPNFTEFMAPGIILAVTYIISVGLTALSIVIERKEGLLERCWVIGVGAGEMIFSILFCFFVTMILQVALVLIFAFFVFDLPVQGSVFWVIVCLMLSGTSGMAYGLFISSICQTEVAAMLIAIGSFFPSLMLSGILWPIEGMDYYLRYVSYCMPLTTLSDTMRSVMSRGWGITEHYTWVGFVIPSVWTASLILIAGVIFKYNKSK